MNFELRQGGKGNRPMSVDTLRDSASTRRQQSRNLKGEGYIFTCQQIDGISALQICYNAVLFFN